MALSRKVEDKIIDIIKYLFLGTASFISLFPFLWMITGATNSSRMITEGRLLPGNELMLNLEKLLESANVVGAFWNTSKVAIISTLLSLFITSLAAFGFEKYSSKKKEKVYNGMLLSMMIPFAALMIPLFRLVVKMGLIDNHWGIILPTIASAFLIFFFRQSFKSFPNEMIEAARIDGASEFKIYLKIVIPTMKSTFAAAAIIVFMTQWNNFLWPLIVLQSDETKTLTLMISSMSSAYFVDYGVLMLAIIIATAPVIIIFMTMQRQFVEGMTGSNK